MDLVEDKSHDHQYPRHLTDSRGISGCRSSKRHRGEDREDLVDDTDRISHLERFKVTALSEQNFFT